MNIFRRPDYRSEATQFIAQLKAAKPTLEAEQRQGRSLLWDQVVDRMAWRGFRSAQVAQKPYVYQSQSD
jgi:Tfp pilus assembly protein PilV